MSQLNTSVASINELVSAYARAASLHGAASSKGDYRAANTQYNILSRIYRELRTRGAEAQHELLSLLDSPDVGVKLWAASHALEFAPTAGEPVLEALSRSSQIGISKLTAETTLKEWKKGSLKFP